MKHSLGLSPWGAACRGFESAAGGPERDRMGALLECWEKAVRVYNLEEQVVALAWEVARWQGGLTDEEQAALTLLVLISLIGLREGSTRLPVEGPEGEAYLQEVLKVLLADVPPGAELGPQRMLSVMSRLLRSGRAGALVGAPPEFKPLLLVPPFLYQQKMLQLEDRFVEAARRRLGRRGAGPAEAEAKRKLREVLERPAVRGGRALALTEEQQRAVLTAAASPLTVISGGPGTGKTTVVVSILRVLRRLGVAREEVALAAPTGKAANRLGETIRQSLEAIPDPDPLDRDLLGVPAPRTLHRLLGYAPGTDRFRHHQNNRLAERVVIVDEASMIDLVLMERLARSLRDDARLVLLGDAEQLPSVEAGAVLRDLMHEEPGGPPLLGGRAVRLRHSHRMDPSDPAGRHILTIAGRINRGEAEALLDPGRTGNDLLPVRASVGQVAFDRVELLSAGEDAATVPAFLERWYREHVCGLEDFGRLVGKVYEHGPHGFAGADRRDLERVLGHYNRSRLLCLTRVLPTGSERVNAWLHARFLDDFGTDPDLPFHPGEPVLMQVNDYGRMIFNGDQGLVLRVAEGGGPPQPLAVFPRAEDFGLFSLDALQTCLQLAFAMTVHKSQGSEFDHVALLLPEQDQPINSRELLYTAVTRSRRSVTIVGSPDVLEKGVGRKIRRYSGIAEKLGRRAE